MFYTHGQQVLFVWFLLSGQRQLCGTLLRRTLVRYTYVGLLSKRSWFVGNEPLAKVVGVSKKEAKVSVG